MTDKNWNFSMIIFNWDTDLAFSYNFQWFQCFYDPFLRHSLKVSFSLKIGISFKKFKMATFLAIFETFVVDNDSQRIKLVRNDIYYKFCSLWIIIND